MKVIALIGLIGSGKSTVAGFLRELGVRVIDADEVAHQVYAPGTEGFQKVVAAFGKDIVTPGGQIDRARLGRLVFSDRAARLKLNAALHPLITRRVQKLLAEYRRAGVPLVALEAPLLIEVGWLPLVDEVWLTTAPRETIYQRLRARRGLHPVEVLARIRAQLPVAEQKRHATRVINTATSLRRLQTTVRRHYEAACDGG